MAECPQCHDTGSIPDPETRYYRIGPEFESRALGRWPSQSTYGIWSESIWRVCLVHRPMKPGPNVWPEIGCDVARFGDDFTAIHCRWGATSLLHERHNGWSTTTTAARLMELARELSNLVTKEKGIPCLPNQIKMKVDDTGVGGGVTDTVNAHNFHSMKEQQYTVIPVAAGARANNPELYQNKRSELWFVTAEKAAKGLVDFSRLPAEFIDERSEGKARLKRQLMAPLWQLRGTYRIVEPKEKTKERLPILGSPDDADGVNLAYYSTAIVGTGFDSADTSRMWDRPQRE